MLPALKSGRLRLADVMPSCFEAISGQPNVLGLPAVNRAVVVLVDGLGAAALKARAGHARTLMAQLTAASVIESGFPTTTASALATITTGTLAGQHGMVGYSVRDSDNSRIIKQLSGMDSRIDPLAWQPQTTVFERAVDAGFEAVVIGPGRYSDTGFTKAVLRGARYISAASIVDRTERAAQWLREPGPAGIAYVYIPELDMSGHADGSESPRWTAWLETIDSAIADLVRALRPRDGLIVTADHGVLDIPERAHIHIDSKPALLAGIEFIAGEPRCLQLYFDSDASHKHRAAVVAAWRESEESRAWIATRDEAIAAGWFGVVRPEVIPRIGDILIAARKNVAYYDGRTLNSTTTHMVGQHGSLTPQELNVPLLRFGAFSAGR
jgi:hypothetical protein